MWDAFVCICLSSTKFISGVYAQARIFGDLEEDAKDFRSKSFFCSSKTPPQHCALKHCRLVIYACALRAKSRSVLNTVCAGPHLQKIGGFAHAYLGTSDTVN